MTASRMGSGIGVSDFDVVVFSHYWSEHWLKSHLMKRTVLVPPTMDMGILETIFFFMFLI